MSNRFEEAQTVSKMSLKDSREHLKYLEEFVEDFLNYTKDLLPNLLCWIYAILSVIIIVWGVLVKWDIVPAFAKRFFNYGKTNIPTGGSKDKDESRFVKFIKSYLEVPKRWFSHFYLFAIVVEIIIMMKVWVKYFDNEEDNYAVYEEKSGLGLGKIFEKFVYYNWIQNLLEYCVGKYTSTTVDPPTTMFVCFLYMVHLNRRHQETLTLQVFSDAKMNILHYILGYIHYTCAALSLISQSSGFSSEQSLNQNYHYNDILHLQWISPLKIVGLGIFIGANYLQFSAHETLASIRKVHDGKKDPTLAQQYKIPRGGFFDLVSCPHYFAEIIVYFSLTLITNCSVVAWNWCTIFVISNQIMAAISTHDWYHKKFKDTYPKSRKAIIPFIL